MVWALSKPLGMGAALAKPITPAGSKGWSNVNDFASPETRYALSGDVNIAYQKGRDIGGIAVHAAARVMAKSESSEVLVSRVVTDLVAGAGLT